MSVYFSILLYLLCAFNFGESLPKNFGEGAPKGIELKMEVSPDTPVLGELFSIRVTVTNVGDKDIEMPDCIVPSFLWGDNESGYLLDILSSSLKENRVFHTSFSAAFSDVGYTLLPELYRKPLFDSKTSILSPGKSRVLLLDRIKFTPGLDVTPDGWNKFVHEKEAKIRFSYFGKDETNTGSIVQPIRVLSAPDITEYVKIENEIVDKKIEDIRNKNDPDMDETQMRQEITGMNQYRSMACFLLPTDEGIAMSDKYPSGTIRANFYLTLLANKYLETDNNLDEIIRWFWTLPEVERQVHALSILTRSGHNKQIAKLRTNRRFLEVLIKNFPIGYNVVFNGNPVEVFTQYADCTNLTNDEIESIVKDILKSPIPQYAGRGNLQRGFFIAPRKWSFSDEEFQLISYFNTDVTFKDQDGNIKTFPADKLSSEEQKFLRTLSDFPQTGVW